MPPAPAAGQVPASVSLFDLSADAPVLQGLSLVSHPPGETLAQALPTSSPDPREKASPERKPLQGPLDISEKLFCSTCDQTFQNHQEQREHYKLDWHRFNLKQRLKNKPLLSALDFEKQSCTGDLSSISGSEDSDSASEDLQILDEERAELEKPIRPRGFHPHRVLFQNAQGQFLYAYRCVLGPHQVPPKEPELLLQTLQSGGPRCCVVLMAAAGHFAGAIFQGREVVVHKTFHRYTVRAKQGTAQGLRDAQGGASRSAGANLRRYNEVTLCKDVRDLLAGPSWAEALGEAGTILLHAPRSGRSLFFGGHGAPLQRGDPRLWDIPLATRRPTFRELQRVLHKLTTLHVHGEDPRKTVWLDSPQSHWKTMKERKKAIEEDRQVSNDENETLGQTEDSRKQGSGSEEEDNFQVELELVELTVGTLDLCEFEALPKRRRRKRSKREKSQDLATGAHMTPLQQPQDETFSHSAQAHAAPLGPSLEEVNAPDQSELWDVLLAACRAGDVGMLKLQLAISPVDPRVLSLLSAPLGSNGFTLLHAAAAAGRGSVVRLLLEAGADPTVRDSRTRPPYMVAADKSTRNEFRRFMEKNPDAYDYNKAQVPGPLTPEMESQQATRKRERKAARRQREEQQRKQQEQERREQEEQRQFATLSDREKRALAAERRLAAQLGAPTPQIPNSAIISARYVDGQTKMFGQVEPVPTQYSERLLRGFEMFWEPLRRCWSCGTSLQGLTPFHYLDFSFCSTRCLQDHRCQARKPSS